MAEEVVGVFDAHCLMLHEYGVSKSCVLFLTSNRIIVAIIEGIKPKLGFAVVVSAAIAFTGLLLRDSTLFLAGLFAVIVVASMLVLTNLIVRNRKKRRVKRLAPEEILRTNIRNFEISYSDLVKIKHTSFQKYESVSRFFLPMPPEIAYEIEFATSKEEYVLILDRNDLARCIDLLNKFVPEKIEKDENEEF